MALDNGIPWRYVKLFQMSRLKGHQQLYFMMNSLEWDRIQLNVPLQLSQSIIIQRLLLCHGLHQKIKNQCFSWLWVECRRKWITSTVKSFNFLTRSKQIFVWSRITYITVTADLIMLVYRQNTVSLPTEIWKKKYLMEGKNNLIDGVHGRGGNSLGGGWSHAGNLKFYESLERKLQYRNGNGKTNFSYNMER